MCPVFCRWARACICSTVVCTPSVFVEPWSEFVCRRYVITFVSLRLKNKPREKSLSIITTRRVVFAGTWKSRLLVTPNVRNVIRTRSRMVRSLNNSARLAFAGTLKGFRVVDVLFFRFRLVVSFAIFSNRAFINNRASRCSRGSLSAQGGGWMTTDGGLLRVTYFRVVFTL